MLKIFLTLIVVLISVYWVGEKARRNPRIDAFLTAIEGHYSSLNERLEDSTTFNGLKFLRKFYGWISIILFAGLFAALRFSQPNPTNALPLFSIFAFSFMGWFSIKWVTEHKNTVAEFSRDNALIIFGPLIIGIFDMLFGTPFMEILARPLHQIPIALNLNIPQVLNPLAIGSIISLVLLVFFGIYYLLTWLVTAPVFLISVFAVLLPIKIARLLAAIDRKNTFFWFTVLAMGIISAWLTQL